MRVSTLSALRGGAPPARPVQPFRDSPSGTRPWPERAAVALRVVVAHPDALHRAGVAGLLRDNDIDVVGTVAGGEAVVRTVLDTDPDLVLVGVDGDGGAALESARRLAESRSHTPVLIFGRGEPGDRFPAGAVAYLRMDAGAERVEAALRIAIAVLAPRNASVTRSSASARGGRAPRRARKPRACA